MREYMDMADRKMELILTGVLLLMPAVYGANPTTEQVAYVGQDAVLRCPLTELNTVSFPGWERETVTVYTQPGGAINPAYADRVSYDMDNTSLVIKNIQLSDAGSYICRTISGIVREGIITLHTRIRPQPPVISNRQPDGTVTGTEGQSLTLTCTSQGGNPSPTATWYRGSSQPSALASSNSGPLESDGYTVTATYTFSPTSADDGSIYICQTSYRSPTLEVLDSSSATLRLNLKPSQPRVAQVGDVVAGSTVTVRCTTAGFRPAERIAIAWTYNGGDYSQHATPTHTNGTDTNTATSTLQFTVQKADNGGWAECIVAHSTLGTPLTGTTTIDVHYHPESATVTGNHVIVANGVNPLTLTCVVGVGNPAATAIIWTRTSKTGTVIPVSAQNPLVLTPTRVDDGNTVVCTADNGIGSVTSAPATLDLRFYPITTVTISPTGLVTEGLTDVTLQCSAHSNPAATITWYHNGNTLQGGQDVTTYKITSVSRQDAGEYKCIATNTVSPPTGDTSNTAVVTLIVQFPPLSVTIDGNRVIEADGHDKLQLNCVVGESSPISTITWSKKGTVVIGSTHAMQDASGSYGGYTRSQVLELTPTRDNDGDTITCTADNGVGQSVTHTITLNLKYSAIASFPRRDETVVEGALSKELTCNANSKPAATFKWYKGTSSTTLASGSATGSGNQWTSTYTIVGVDRSNAGRYRCVADNGVGAADETTMTMSVYYPPDVTATAQLNNGQLVATCSPSGVPDSYHYSNWVRLWSDGTPISQTPPLAATQTLMLTPLAYQDSGIYTCGAGNGVGLNGAMSAGYTRKGSTSVITIESPPIIIGPAQQKVPIKLHEPTTVSITYYSNVAGSTVSCHRVVNNITQSQSVGVVTTKTSSIQLHVYESLVSEQGTNARVTLILDTEAELGAYVVKITNTVGTAMVHLLAVAADANTTTTIAPPHVRSDIRCEADAIAIFLPGSVFPAGHNITWREERCTVTYNGSHYVDTVRLNDCGTTVHIDTDTVTFYNELTVHRGTHGRSPGNNDITYGDDHETVIPVKCIYPRQSNVSTSYEPVKQHAHFIEKRYGDLDIAMLQYETEQFRTPVPTTSYPRSVPLNDDIFIRIGLNFDTSDIGVKVDHCIATSTPSPADIQWHSIIQSGCPSSHTRLLSASGHPDVRFAFKAFDFSHKTTSYIYVHCEVSVCDHANCTMGCPPRVRRAAADDTYGGARLVTAGPLFVEKRNAKENAGSAVSMTTVFAGLCLCVAMVAVVVAVIGWRRQSRK